MATVPSADRGRIINTRAHLTILSDGLAAAELEALIGLKPDGAWTKGDQMPGGTRGRSFNGVVYESRVDEVPGEPEAHVESLVRRLDPYAERIAALAGELRVESARLWVVIHTTGHNPAYAFSPETLGILGRMGVELDVDVYVHHDDE
jgi:hypothetical protein